MNGTTNVYSPSTFEDNDGWTTPENAYSSNNSYAEPGAKDDNVTYLTYGVTQVGGEEPATVEVGIEGYGDGDDFLDIEVSWDGGLSWSTIVPYTPPSSDPDIPTYVDLTDGRTWTWDELSNANFRVRVTKKDTLKGNPLYLDWIPVRIHSEVAGTVYDIYVTATVAASEAMSPEQTLNLNQVAGVDSGESIGLSQVLNLSFIASILAEASYLFPTERFTVNFPEVEITAVGEPGEKNLYTVATGKMCRVMELTIYHEGTEDTLIKLLVGTTVKLRVPIPPQTERTWTCILGRKFTAGQVIKVQGSSILGGTTYISGSGLEAPV